MIRLILVDDHPIVRQGLASLFDMQDGFEVVGEAATVREGARLYQTEKPDVALVDMRLTDGQAVDLIRELKVWDPQLKSIVLSTHDDEVDVLRAFEAGAHAYLLKSGGTELIIETVNRVAAGKQAVPDWVEQRLSGDRRRTELTARERDILRLLVQGGGSNRELAQALNITAETVKTHLNSIRSKLDAKDRAGAVAVALKRGLI